MKEPGAAYAVPGFFLALAFLGFVLGVKGLGGVFSIRLKTSSSLGVFIMPMPIRKPCHLELVGLVKRPEHAQALGNIVAASGRIEGTLGWLLAFFSGGSAAITVPMFQAVVSTDAQKAMLEVAAEKALSGPEYLLFKALMEEFRPRYRERSRLVHNLWGHSNDHPDKAIWCPAEESALPMIKVAMARTVEELTQNQNPADDLSTKCVAYTVKDIQ